MEIPRKTVGSWLLAPGDNTVWEGISQEAIATAHETNHETGDLLVPEEGTVFVETFTIPRV